jgi:hypothetical protein
MALAPCTTCKQPFQPLSDKILACACQDALSEAAPTGAVKRYPMSPHLRNRVVAGVNVAQNALTLCKMLVGTDKLAYQIRPINNPYPKEVMPPCKRCGSLYHALFDQFMVCGCQGTKDTPGVIVENAGTAALREYPASPALRNLILLVTQISSVSQAFAQIAMGGGAPQIDTSAFGATVFGSR